MMDVKRVLISVGVVVAVLVAIIAIAIFFTSSMPVGPAAMLSALAGIGLGYIAGMVISSVWGWI